MPTRCNLFDPASSAPYALSRSGISEFQACGRCFWLHRRLGVRQPSLPSMSINRALDAILKRELDFHGKVQAEWRARAEGRVESEKPVRGAAGRRGRMDVFVDAGGAKALVEIKNTDWDAQTGEAVRRNVLRQARQVWRYVESQPNGGEGVCPGIVFPRRPANSGRLRAVDALFSEQGMAVSWEDETVEERKARI